MYRGEGNETDAWRVQGRDGAAAGRPKRPNLTAQKFARYNRTMDRTDIRIDVELNLRGVHCPYNFVRTKLKLEEMKVGEILAVTVDAGEPARNVPRSVADDGHRVLEMTPLDSALRIVIEKVG
jgi:TusA-related sulfurtransferase